VAVPEAARKRDRDERRRDRNELRQVTTGGTWRGTSSLGWFWRLGASPRLALCAFLLL